jgi:hypothetical protein
MMGHQNDSDDALLLTGGLKPACVTLRRLASAGRCLETSESHRGRCGRGEDELRA